MDLWQIIDMSGSMAEGGKRLIVREILRTLEQFVRYNDWKVNLKYLLVGDDTRVIDVSLPEHYPDALFTLEKHFNVINLIEALQDVDGKFLLISDCEWGHSVVSKMKIWRDELPDDSLRIIQVAPPPLRFPNDFDIFLAEELPGALEGWLNGPVQQGTPQQTEDVDEW